MYTTNQDSSHHKNKKKRRLSSIEVLTLKQAIIIISVCSICAQQFCAKAFTLNIVRHTKWPLLLEVSEGWRDIIRVQPDDFTCTDWNDILFKYSYCYWWFENNDKSVSMLFDIPLIDRTELEPATQNINKKSVSENKSTGKVIQGVNGSLEGPLFH